VNEHAGRIDLRRAERYGFGDALATAITDHQHHLIEQRQLSPASINCFVSAAKFIYTVTLEMPWTSW